MELQSLNQHEVQERIGGLTVTVWQLDKTIQMLQAEVIRLSKKLERYEAPMETPSGKPNPPPV